MTEKHDGLADPRTRERRVLGGVKIDLVQADRYKWHLELESLSNMVHYV